ncbi:MAG: NADH-quinone oxidoreductase subunit A [Thermogutta sp.]|nr:NADH-quinone oxidoreductase subunit A [Thermogutta sp.]HQF13807.1 NADH-quinone oxidoreductase subunit A [Thermogutta sp.]
MEFDAALVPFTLFLMALVGLSIGLIVLGHLCGPHRANPVKAMPYESGVDPFHDARRRFHVRFHLVAIAFLVFDVELLFLYPWVVSLRQSSSWQSKAAALSSCTETTGRSDAGVVVGLGSHESPSEQSGELATGALLQRSLQGILWPGLVFFVLLGLGYAYDWRRGVFDWK